MKKAYVCVLDCGYAGFTAPKFLSFEEKEARIWLMGCNDSCGTSGKCFVWDAELETWEPFK